MWLTGLPVPTALPSPKFHENVYGPVPPVAVAVKVTGLPTVGLALTVKLAARASGLIVTVADLLFVAAFPSVAVTLIVLLPLIEYVVLNDAPVPLAGDPPVAVHENVYGAVPPVAVTVHVTAVLTVPEAGQVMVATRANGLIETVADAVAVAAFASVAVTLIVLLPFVE